MLRIFYLSLFLYTIFFAYGVAAADYYISPNGNDANSGTASSPVKNFDKAWQLLNPGDTLVVKDGTYSNCVTRTNGSFIMNPNRKNGTSTARITVKAENDGKAIINGNKNCTPLQLGDTWEYGYVGDYYNIEGLVFANSSEDVVVIRGNNINLKRVSAYDANVDGNSSVMTIAWTNNILVEDSIVGGTGRKSILIFDSKSVTIRRTVAYWERWDGANFCGVNWPSGNGVHIYSSTDDITLENVISFGPVPGRNIATTNQSDTMVMKNIQILGSVAMNAGTNPDGTPFSYPIPPVNNCGWPVPYYFYPGEIDGFEVYGQGPTTVTFRDIFAYKNGYAGFRIFRPTEDGVGGQDIILDHATLIDNATYKTYPHPEEVLELYEDPELTITNTKVPGTSYNGQGARLQNRYVARTLTNQSLWPWPMESRVQAEFGTYVGLPNYSINNNICEAILKPNGSVSNCSPTGPVPTVPVPTPSPIPSISPTVVPSVIPTPTPSTNVTPVPSAILDNFNRANGTIGSKWTNSLNYNIASNQLSYTGTTDQGPLLWNTPYSSNQEVSVKVSGINLAGAELGLVLKSQSLSNPTSFFTAVYNIGSKNIQFWAFNNTWQKIGNDTPVTLNIGDTFKATSDSSGIVKVYINNNLIVTQNITSWANYNKGGYIGLYPISYSAGTYLFDDFSGGDIPTGIITPSPSASVSINPSIDPRFDVNRDGVVNLSDVLALIAKIFE